jgi:hypothetical protein
MTYTSKPERLLWLSDNRGVYIPQAFAESFIDRDSCVTGVSADDWTILESGPDNESYWDAWTDVCDAARVTIDGHVYSLNQDGDLWLIPDGLEWNDDSQCFEWPLESPFEHVQGSPHWASYFINGDASGLEESEIALADAWMRDNGIREVIDVRRDDCGEALESSFSWRYGDATGDSCSGGDLIDYVCEMLPVFSELGEALTLESHYQWDCEIQNRSFKPLDRAQWLEEYQSRPMPFPHA